MWSDPAADVPVPDGSSGSPYPRPQGYFSISTPLAPSGILLLPDPREVPGEPGWLFCFLLISLCSPRAWLFGSSAPSSAGRGEEAAPRRGGCIFSAGFARYLEGKKPDLFTPMARLLRQASLGPVRQPRGADASAPAPWGCPGTVPTLPLSILRTCLCREKPRLPPRRGGTATALPLSARGRDGSCLCREGTRATLRRVPRHAAALLPPAPATVLLVWDLESLAWASSPVPLRSCRCGTGSGWEGDASYVSRRGAPSLPLQHRRAVSGPRAKRRRPQTFPQRQKKTGEAWLWPVRDGRVGGRTREDQAAYAWMGHGRFCGRFRIFTTQMNHRTWREVECPVARALLGPGTPLEEKGVPGGLLLDCG